MNEQLSFTSYMDLYNALMQNRTIKLSVPVADLELFKSNLRMARSRYLKILKDIGAEIEDSLKIEHASKDSDVSAQFIEVTLYITKAEPKKFPYTVLSVGDNNKTKANKNNTN